MILKGNNRTGKFAVMLTAAAMLFTSLSSTTAATAATVVTPTAPVSLSASNLVVNTIKLTWKAPTKRGATKIKDYVVQYRVDGTSRWVTFTDGVSAKLSASVTNLAPLVDYNFRVAAKNTNGTGAYAYASAKTKKSGIADAPAGVTTSSGGATRINLEWTVPFNLNDGTIIDYVVSYKVNGASTWIEFPHPASTDTFVTVTGLTPSTRYDFKVAAKTTTGVGGVATTTGTTDSIIASVVSVGDSITRAFDVKKSFSCIARDCEQYSWSTGTETAVNSHFMRVKALNGDVVPVAYNYAVTGSKIADLDTQLKRAATATGSYVTVLSGANDICKATTTGTMTTTSAFRTSFTTALTNYVARNPDTKIFVSSIPNINSLYNVAKDLAGAQAIWDNTLVPVCPLVLDSKVATAATRSAVATRIAEYNTALQSVCTVTFAANCKFDDLATYNYVFKASEISTVDFFHPSIEGQKALSAVTWAKSWWSR